MEKVSQKEVKVIYSSWLLGSQNLYSGNLVPVFFFPSKLFFFWFPLHSGLPRAVSWRHSDAWVLRCSEGLQCPFTSTSPCTPRCLGSQMTTAWHMGHRAVTWREAHDPSAALPPCRVGHSEWLLFPLSRLGPGGQWWDPEAGQCFVLVIACRSSIIWALPWGSLGHEGVKEWARKGHLLLHEAPHVLLCPCSNFCPSCLAPSCFS